MGKQYNKNKLNVQQSSNNSPQGSQTLVFLGVGLIALALLLFGFIFFSSKGGKDDSSSQGESSAKDSSSSQAAAESSAAVTTAGSTKKTSESTGGEKTADNAQTQVHFVDVGQGDCTLVISKGEAMLVDCGEMDDTNKVINYMKQLGITKLKYIIVTHPHTDHMGEMPDILKAFKADNFIMPKVPDSLVPTIMRYEKMLRQVKAQGLDITWSSDTRFKLGDVTVDTYTPKKAQEGLNNYSTIVKLTCGEKKFLITGDCEKEEEADILSQGFDLKADVLKVPHHGSCKGTTDDLLKAVGAKYAVISCGKDNDYGHPHDVTVKRIKKYISEIYVTKDNGNVVFTVNGSSLTVKKQRG